MIKHIFSITFIAFVSVIIISSCQQGSKYDESGWTYMDPLSIPLEVRQQQFDKENIVNNSSFEEGETQLGDTIIKEFKLNGWQKVGDRVQWVNTEIDAYKDGEVNEGKHAIKITRSGKLDDYSPEDGVLSDYIPVIPGNYLFYYNVRLENVFPSQVNYRMGNKLRDAVNIRLMFYDRNKKEINGMQEYPYYKTDFDNTFKGFAFSNFFYVDKFPWGEVKGRTYNYPYSEGDVPDDCRYVKIFLGFKGRGTMWVDDVDFRLSRWNFTTVERLNSHFEKEYSLTDFIVPTPKKVEAIGPYKYFTKDDGAEMLPVILIPASAKKQTVFAAEMLQQKLQAQIDKLAGDDTPKVKIVSQISENDLSSGRLIFSLGKNKLYSQYAKELQDSEVDGKEHGYIVRTLKDSPSIVFLVGNEPIGDYYAATTAAQLLDSEKLVYEGANVSDWPDFIGRSYAFRSYRGRWEMEQDTSLSPEEIDEEIAESKEKWEVELNSMDLMSFYKLNKIYTLYNGTSKRWWSPPQITRQQHKEAGAVCKKTGVTDIAMMINPYFHFGYENEINENLSDSMRYLYSHSDPISMEKLKNAYRVALDNGAKYIMLNSDDFTPHTGSIRGHYDVYTKEDRKRFVNLANAQAYVINHLYDWLNKEYPGAKIEFCPAPYLNEFVDRGRGTAEAFFTDLMYQIPKDIGIIWTGNTVRSLAYDMADIKRYTDFIGVKPMMWDNTLYARTISGIYGGYGAYYPGKVRMCNLFEPYDIIVPKNFHEHMFSQFYTNGSAESEAYKVKYITVGDFMWNVNDYDADFSLYRVMVKQFGKEISRELLNFNDNYFGLFDMCMRIERGSKPEYIRQANEFSEKMNAILEGLDKSLTSNKKLVKELRENRDKLIERYKKLIEENKAEEKVGLEQV